MAKQIIRLTESDLHRIVRESVRNMLGEGRCWYGDEKPLQEIIRMAGQIMSGNGYTDEDGYEPMDDDGGDIHGELYRWAKNVRDEAEEWLRCNSSNTPVGDGTW